MAIAEDASTPVIVTATSDTTGVITSPSFSPPAGAVVLVQVSATFDTGATASSITVADSASNSYHAGPFQHVASHDANAGMWWFYYSTAPGSITVTATDTSTAAAGREICVRVINGAAADQSASATATNSGAPGTGVTTDCAITISPTKTGSVIYGIVADGTSGASTATPDIGTTNISDASNPHNNATDKSTVAVGTSAGNIGWTITTTFWWAGVAMEIVPNTNPFIAGSKAAAATTTFTVPVTTPTNAGDTLLAVLSNSSSTTVTAITDSQGNVYTLDTSSASSPVTYFYRSPGSTGGSGGGQTAGLTASDTLTLTLSAATGTQNATLICAPAVGDLDAQSATNNGTSTTASPSATPTFDADWAIGAIAVANAGGSPSASSPYTSLGVLNTAGGVYTIVDYDELATGTAGVSQSTTFTWGTSAGFRSKLWLFKPPAPSGHNPYTGTDGKLATPAQPGLAVPGAFIPGQVEPSTVTVTANAAWTGTGTWGAVANVTRLRAAAWTGTGALTVTANVTRRRAAAWTGTGTWTAAAAVVLPASAAWIGTGSWAATANVTRRRTTSWTGTGTFTAAANVTRRRTATWSGVGTLTAAAHVTRLRTAGWSGTGSWTAAANVTRTRTAGWSGTGVWGATASTQGLHNVTAAWTGTGTFSATANTTRLRAASWTGTGTWAAGNATVRSRTAAWSGAGTWGATEHTTRLRTAAWSGVGNLTVNVAVQGLHVVLASWNGTGSWGALGFKTVPAAAPWNGTGVWGGAAHVFAPAAAAWSGAGVFGGTEHAARIRTALWSGRGLFTAGVLVRVPFASLAGLSAGTPHLRWGSGPTHDRGWSAAEPSTQWGTGPPSGEGWSTGSPHSEWATGSVHT